MLIEPLRKSVLRRCMLIQTGRPVFEISLASASVASTRFGSVSSQYAGVYKHLESSYSYRIAKAAQNMLTNCLRNDLGDRIDFISLTPGKMITELAQTDADITPEDAARRIIEAWENGALQPQNGIVQLPDMVIPW